ncbi:MAG TPA: DoxX family protein [Herpetosiphonaceae bacterium]
MTTAPQTRSTPRWQTYAVYAVMALLTLGFLFFGGMKLAGAQMNVDNFTRWGYPIWFMYLTGLIEVVGAVLLWPQRTRLIGALLLVATMLGAIATHLVNGEAAFIAMPVVLLLLAAFVAWSNRPQRA